MGDVKRCSQLVSYIKTLQPTSMLRVTACGISGMCDAIWPWQQQQAGPQLLLCVICFSPF